MPNPLFNAKTIDNTVTASDAMTVSGTIGKSAFLTLLTIAMAAVGWSFAATMPAIAIVGIVGALVVVLITAFKPTFSPIAAPLYAIFEGVALGVISAFYTAKYHNAIVLQALFLTFGVLFAMLTLYQTRIIRVTERLRSIIILATVGIAIMYLAFWIFQLFGMQLPINNGSGFAIGLNVVIAVIAALNFLLDFDNIERGAAARAPKYMEWTASLGLLITIVWLYLEILRLLAQLNGGDRR